MRLTNTIRNAFVRSVLNDVPKVDYKEKAEKIIREAAIEALPDKVREVYDDKKLREYVTNCYLGYHSNAIIPNLHKLIPSIQIPGLTGTPPRFGKEIIDKLTQLFNLNEAQTTKHSALEIKLRAIAFSVNTKKALVELLPEFEKYLPSEDPVVNRSLPTITNVISEFKQAGWPKSKE
jgi:hypothetical protein